MFVTMIISGLFKLIRYEWGLRLVQEKTRKFSHLMNHCIEWLMKPHKLIILHGCVNGLNYCNSKACE